MTKRLAVIMIAACFFTTFFVVDLFNIQATPSNLSDFQKVYGDAIVSKFGCEICHRSGSTRLNEYGEDLSNVAGFGCQDFNPPSSHTIVQQRGTCEAKHAPGYSQPLASNCVGCHGSNLTGGNAPSCYTCHGKLWQNGGNSSCPDFDPPGDHTIYKDEDGCGAYHKDGYEHPIESGCTDCHGANLRGWSGPSCYTCHGAKWNDDDAPPSLPRTTHPSGIKASAFREIEKIDSDGDGFTNKEEIDALTNPGDSDSFPLGENAFTLKMTSEWDRSWIKARGEISVRITSKNGVAIDDSKPITLSVGKNSLSTMKIKSLKGGTVADARFQKALTFCLFSGGGKNMGVSVEGTLVDGTAFSLIDTVSLVGNAPEQLTSLRIKTKPKKLSEGTDMTFEIQGTDAGNIDVNSKMFAVGMYRQVKLQDVQKNGNTIVISVSAKDIERLFGSLSSDALYTIGIRGNSETKGEFFCVAADMKASTSSGGGGGGGQDPPCYDFSPPSSHTVKRTIGKCSYFHKPGASNPFGNGCTACHGSDLSGSSFAPSCTLCHGVKW